MVETRYAELGTPARLRRARKAATPAFVCVKTRMGLLCVCAMSVGGLQIILTISEL